MTQAASEDPVPDQFNQSDNSTAAHTSVHSAAFTASGQSVTGHAATVATQEATPVATQVATPAATAAAAPTTSKAVALSGGGLAFLLFMAHFSNDMFSGVLAALLPTLQERFNASEVTLALFVACLSFSGSVLQPLFGAVADRLGHRLVAALGVILSSSVLSLMAVMPSPLLLVPLLLIGGLGSASFHPAGSTLARRAAGSKASLALGIFSAGGTVGSAFGPLLIGFFLINGWLQFSPLLMVPGIIFGLLILLLAPPQPRNTSVHRAKIFDMELVRGPVGQLCLAGILRSVAWTSVFNGTSLWLVNAKGLSSTNPVVFASITTFTVFAALGGIVAGMLERRLGRQWLVTGSMVLATVPLAIMFVSTPGSVLYFIAVALAGMFVNGGLPIMVVAAQDAAPHAVATASGMLMGLTWGTAGVMYLGVGAIQGAIGIGATMWLSLVPLIPGALIAYRVMRQLEAKASNSPQAG